jgi:hypothetical protein
MSLCSFCGLDLDTGMRVGLNDDFEEQVPAAARTQSLPIGIGVVGGIAFLGSLVLAAFSLVQWTVNHKEGYEFLGLVCLFGMFAAVQFLRGKTPKLLIIALSLGALIDVVALLALPVYNANEESGLRTTVVSANANEDEPEGPVIKPYIDRLDYNSITWGIAILLIYASVVVYLMSPSVRRHFERAQQDPLAHIKL